MEAVAAKRAASAMAFARATETCDPAAAANFEWQYLNEYQAECHLLAKRGGDQTLDMLLQRAAGAVARLVRA